VAWSDRAFRMTTATSLPPSGVPWRPPPTPSSSIFVEDLDGTVYEVLPNLSVRVWPNDAEVPMPKKTFPGVMGSWRPIQQAERWMPIGERLRLVEIRAVERAYRRVEDEGWTAEESTRRYRRDLARIQRCFAAVLGG
jgi:hypothetical protein